MYFRVITLADKNILHKIRIDLINKSIEFKIIIIITKLKFTLLSIPITLCKIFGPKSEYF